MNRLIVQTRSLQPMMAVILGVICIPLAAGSLYGGLAGGIKPVPLAIGVMMLGTYLGVVWLARRGRTMSVKYFSEEGLERQDGRWLAWGDLERVVDQIRVVQNRKQLWRTEIQFRGGQTAWLIPIRVGNYGEVNDFVRRLPCNHTEVNV